MPASSLVFLFDHHGIDAMVATKEMRPERSTIEMLRPSAPTKYSMLKVLIQVKWWTSWTPESLSAMRIPGAVGSNHFQASTAQAKERPLARRAMSRDMSSRKRFGSPNAKRKRVKIRIAAAPMSGRQVAQVSTVEGPNMKGSVTAR